MALTSVIDTSNKVPGAYLQVSLGVGRRSAGSAAREVLLVGNKTASGSSAVEVVQPLYSLDDARTLFGAGSELFMMAKAAFEANPNVTLHGIAVTESAGTAATGTITLTSGPATAAGTFETWIGGERIVTAIASGDSISDVATAIAADINAVTDLPVTAGSSLGVVTVTAKLKGPKSNAIRLRTLLTGGTGISHTALNTSLSSGATLDDPQNALDAVAQTHFSYIVASDDDSTNVPKYETHIEAKDEPEVGLRERFFFGSADTLANAITLSDAVNAKRGQLCWHYNGEQTPAMVAAACAAVHAKELTSDRAKPLDGYVVPGLTPQYSETDRPLNSESISALNNGITPLGTSGGSEVSIVRSITNYSTDSSSNPDYSVLDVSKVEVPDLIADTLEANFLSEFAGFKLDNDPVGSEQPEPGVATPRTIKAWIFGILKDYAAGGSQPLQLQNVDEFEELIVVELDVNADGRANAAIPIDVVEGFHQFAADVRQAG